MVKKPLFMAIYHADYAMVKLLIENVSKTRKNHIACASRESCQMIICKNVPKDFDSPDVDPDQPINLKRRLSGQPQDWDITNWLI
jgi:hypothetical protein